LIWAGSTPRATRASRTASRAGSPRARLYSRVAALVAVPLHRHADGRGAREPLGRLPRRRPSVVRISDLSKSKKTSFRYFPASSTRFTAGAGAGGATTGVGGATGGWRRRDVELRRALGHDLPPAVMRSDAVSCGSPARRFERRRRGASPRPQTRSGRRVQRDLVGLRARTCRTSLERGHSVLTSPAGALRRSSATRWRIRTRSSFIVARARREERARAPRAGALPNMARTFRSHLSSWMRF